MKHIALGLLTILLIILPIKAAYANSGLLFGYALGKVGGEEPSSPTSSGGQSVLYINPEAIKASNPLEVRFGAINACVATKAAVNNYAHWTARELFTEVTKTRDPKLTRTLLRVIRVFDVRDPNCASFWFEYLEY